MKSYYSTLPVTVKYFLLGVGLFALQPAMAEDRVSEVKAVLEWSQLHVVAFPVDGRVVAVHARPGDRVKKGDKLIDLSTEPNEIRVRQFRAAVDVKKPAVTDTKREYDQALSLYEQTVLSDVELQKAKLAYEKASAELDLAKAQLDLERWKLRKKTAVAPWDALVISRDIEPGIMLVDEQRTRNWMVLAKADVLGASATISAATASHLHTGQSVSVSVGSQAYQGKIIELEQMSGAELANYRLLVEFNLASANNILPGMAATVVLP
jgi:RND family efflux transporter MFP subunit